MRESLQEWLNEVLAILVIYEIPPDESETFTSLGKSLEAEQVALDLFIYDNSPSAQTIGIKNSGWKIYYHPDSSNPGVSKAYNEGFKKALNLGKKWLLLLDQDTRFPQDFFTQYFRCLSGDKQYRVFVPLLKDKYGIVSPFKFKWGDGKRLKKIGAGVYNMNDLKFHNSGFLISTEEFQKAGCYDENLPLDFSDIAFNDRLRQNQSSFVLAPVTGLHHLASTGFATHEKRLARFRMYIKANRYYRETHRPSDILMSLRLLLRAIRLSVKYRSFEFLKAALL